MITTVHFLVGGAVGVATNNPYAAFAAGVASHLVIDSIPHLDVSPSAPRKSDGEVLFTPALWAQVWIDGLVALAILAFFWSRLDGLSLSSPFLWGALGGFFPDLVDNVPFWNKPFRATALGTIFHRIHDATHDVWQGRFPMDKYYLLGVLTQLVVSFAAIVLALNL